jgi:putative endonuclease
VLGSVLRRDGSLGRRGERAAARHLRRRGYRVLGRNVRLPGGEVDLVALAPDRRTVVVVEVKTRAADSAIPAEESVTGAKRRKLLDLTERLIARNAWTDRPVRIDVVAVAWRRRGRPSIRHFEDAVARPGLTPSTGARRASRGRRPRA